MQKNNVECCEMKLRVVEWSVAGCNVTHWTVSDTFGKEWSLLLQNGKRQNVVECRVMEGDVVDWSAIVFNVT